jgi:hypothetical protein
MVIDFIVGTFFGFIQTLVELLPAAGAGPNPLPYDTSGISQVVGLVQWSDSWLPVHETLAAAAGYLALLGGIYAYLLIRTVARWLPSWITGGG